MTLFQAVFAVLALSFVLSPFAQASQPLIPIQASVQPSVIEDYPQPPQAEYSVKISVHPGWNLISAPVSWYPFVYETSSQTTSQAGYGSTERQYVDDPEVYEYQNTNYRTNYAFLVETNCESSTVFSLNPYSKEYDKTDVSHLVSNKGYWFNSNSYCSLVFKGVKAFEYQDGLKLSSGWNQIPGSYTPMTFENLKNDCKVESGPWYYDKRWVKTGLLKTSFLESGKSYFVKVSGECTLKKSFGDIPPLPE